MEESRRELRVVLDPIDLAEESGRELTVVLDRMDLAAVAEESRQQHQVRSVSASRLRVVLERMDISAVAGTDASERLASVTATRRVPKRRAPTFTSQTLRKRNKCRQTLLSQTASSSDTTSQVEVGSPPEAVRVAVRVSSRSSSVGVAEPAVVAPAVLPVVAAVGEGVVRPPPRRRHAAVPHRVTYRFGVNSLAEAVEGLCAAPFNCGAFDRVCTGCGALFFQRERGIRQNCCNGGRVVLPPLRCPAEFKDLYTSDGPETTRFLTNIRVANSLFAMASFKTSTPARRVEGQGHWSFSVCGQIYHFTMGVPASQDLAAPVLSHYYFLDVDEVLERRGGMVEGRVDARVLGRIELLLRRYNRYVRAYVTMGEVLREERRRRGGRVRDVTIGFSGAGDMRQKTRQFNLPESRSEIAAVFYGTEPPFPVDLILYPRGEDDGDDGENLRRHELKNMNPLADPLVYPLLFPCGENGWSVHLRARDGRKITLRQFYRFRLQCREGGEFSLLHNGGKLFQQYVVDAWVRVEGDVLWYYRQHQDRFRFTRRRVLARIAAAAAAGADPQAARRVGRPVVLPPAFQSGPRHAQRQYLDAMTVVARHGKPDLFITFTCNPSWPEIVENLAYRQKVENRPDLVCRVFRIKLSEFIDDIVNKQIYGVVLNYHYVVEFQKRGLPHAHIVVTFLADDKIVTPEQVDDIVCAFIPDATIHPRLYELVGTHQVHRPCGPSHQDAPCMVDGVCKKYFPKEYAERTVLGAGGDRRPMYRRPRDGRTVVLRGQTITNTRIVPYNSYALAKYQCHINFEVVGSLATMKYLYKYVSKGVDCATIVEGGDDRGDGTDRIEYDEISRYLECRYVSSMEAVWRILEFKMHDRSHSVMVLPVHLPDEDEVGYDAENATADDLEARLAKRTKLAAWFALNETDAGARRYNYVEIPEHYTWSGTDGMWNARAQISKVIGCLAEVTPKEGNLELFYLRVLLVHVKGATSYRHLREYGGVTYDTYREACEARNLLLRADEYDRCLRDAVTFRHPAQLRRLFALIVCVIDGDRLGQVEVLFQRYRDAMIEDFLRQGVGRREALRRCVRRIGGILARNKPEYSCEGLGITVGDDIDDDDDDGSDSDSDSVSDRADAEPESESDEENGIGRSREYDPATLNEDQRRIFLRVVRAVARNAGVVLPQALYDVMGDTLLRETLDIEYRERRDVFDCDIFYVDGPGGTGKTYLYNCLIDYVRRYLGLRTRAVAWTGIAANLLLGGTTSHRCFRFPISLTAQSVVGWPLEAPESRAVREVALIVWDEAPMTHRYAVEALDRYLRELTGKTGTPMGGKCVVFAK